MMFTGIKSKVELVNGVPGELQVVEENWVDGVMVFEQIVESTYVDPEVPKQTIYIGSKVEDHPEVVGVFHKSTPRPVPRTSESEKEPSPEVPVTTTSFAVVSYDEECDQSTAVCECCGKAAKHLVRLKGSSLLSWMCDSCKPIDLRIPTSSIQHHRGI